MVAGGLGGLKTVRAKVETLTDKLGRRIKMLVGKPGLDGHSNGAEQIALRARDAGFEVVYEGIRLTPEQIVTAALEEGVHVVGLSILSGSHIPLVTEIMQRMKEADIADVPVVVGGIIPPEDARALIEAGYHASTRRRTSTSTPSWPTSSRSSRRRRKKRLRRPVQGRDDYLLIFRQQLLPASHKASREKAGSQTCDRGASDEALSTWPLF